MTAQPPKPKHAVRRPRHQLEALRLIAREAAEAGESLASIRARLRLPESTLNDWALADGFRTKDIAARAAANAEARRLADEAEAIRQQAEDAWAEVAPEGFRTAVEKQVDLARARAGALVEKGLIEAAEDEMAGVRRLARLAAFAGPAAREIARALRKVDDDVHGLAFGLWFRAVMEDDGPAPGPLFAPALRAGLARFADLTDDQKRPWLDAAKARMAAADWGEEGEEGFL
ncbi:MAG: hypothetical protein R3C13_03700 [Hyphomonas sp.]|uniref:hypothetical protein n=1 Tax=Hyphomonas sp. TaxID=87 RepID=UPI00352714A0